MQAFVCDMCGECCRHIDLIPELSEYHNGNGICRYLVENKCSIYYERPEICNVGVMFEKKYRFEMSEEEYLNMNYEGCKNIKVIYK